MSETGTKKISHLISITQDDKMLFYFNSSLNLYYKQEDKYLTFLFKKQIKEVPGLLRRNNKQKLVLEINE